ncbi:MAG: phospho-sugar mutase [Clostridia bacterium]|nr:phospho-sugar mutase [Clostridia bacterium]
MTELEKRIEYWKNDPCFDEETRKEIAGITDEKELSDRFYRDLEFGTAGMRGVMGAGPNRMNKYIIRRATKAFASYLKEVFGESARERGVVIAFDTRNNSKEFARETALTLCAEGVSAYLFADPSPVPLLSYTVRRLRSCGGVAVTASHNPREYNGYKIYDETGCQLTPEGADRVASIIDGMPDMSKARPMDETEALKSGLLHILGEADVDAFCEEVLKQAHPITPEETLGIKIIYTPLHGSGSVPVQKVLRARGFDFSVVREQAAPDGDFPTVKTPNPEDKAALSLGIELAESVGADIVLGTDPDCDRVGIAVKTGDGYKAFTGNQVGALLTYYVLTRRKETLTPRCTLIKTVVTSELGAFIAKDFGIRVIDVLTGFKYIGEIINGFEKTGDTFTIGYEESYGYLVGTHARDKDGVVASMLICEMAAYYNARGKSLYGVLNELYAKYGYFLDKVESITLKGESGAEKINGIMTRLRSAGESFMPGVIKVLDYSKGIDGLPKSNVLKFVWADGSYVAARPSGTEPKIKFYYCVRKKDETEAQSAFSAIKQVISGYTE